MIRTLTYRVCDGCHRSTLEPEPVEIVASKAVTEFCGPTHDLDLCADCERRGMIICRRCARAHAEDYDCRPAKATILEGECDLSDDIAPEYDLANMSVDWEQTNKLRAHARTRKEES